MSGAPATPPLVDVDFRVRMFSPVRIGLAFGLGLGVVGFIMTLTVLALPKVGPVAAVSLDIFGWLVIVVLFLGLILGTARRTRKRVAAFVKDHPGDAASVVRDTLAQFATASTISPLQGLLAALADRAGEAPTVRIAPAAEAVSIEPLAVDFEALPLDETDDQFAQLLVQGSVNAARAADRLDVRTDELLPTRQWKRLRKLGLLSLPIGAGVFFALAAVSSLIRWSVDWDLLLASAYFVISLLFVTNMQSFAMRRALVVPGGVVARVRPCLFSTSRLHLFERGHSVMMVARYSRQRWLWMVREGELRGGGLTTPAEAVLLLRAWLSPLPPPPLERLRGLVQ